MKYQSINRLRFCLLSSSLSLLIFVFCSLSSYYHCPHLNLKLSLLNEGNCKNRSSRSSSSSDPNYNLSSFLIDNLSSSMMMIRMMIMVVDIPKKKQQ